MTRFNGQESPGTAVRGLSRVICVAALIITIAVSSAPGADDKKDALTQTKYQVTGLFMPDREADFREVMETVPDVKVVSIDYKNAEATFEFIPQKISPGAKPEQVLQRIDNLVKTASNSTFTLKPLRKAPIEKLKWIDIPVVGLDCKACSYALYEIVAKLEGVEQATASFKDGRVSALIDPEKTDREKLEAALKKRNVQLKGQ